MNTQKISRKIPQWSALAVIGAVAVAPLVSAPQSAEAAPARPGTSRSQVTTMSGTVSRDLRGREFRLQATNGREYRVIIDAGREPRALTRGDRVQVTGHFTNGDLFIANSLSITNNAGGIGRPGIGRTGQAGGIGRPGIGRTGQGTSLSGTVTRDLLGREFRMRANDGREFRVIIDAGREPRALSRGDRVQAYGRFTAGDLFIANSLNITGNVGRPAYGGNAGRPYYGGNSGRPYYGNGGRPAYGGNGGRPYYGNGTPAVGTRISGIVTKDLLGREFRMAGPDGREIRVVMAQGREPRALSRGDRVEVTGRMTSGIFIANSLSIANNRAGAGRPAYGNGRPAYGQPGYTRPAYGQPGNGYPYSANGQVTFTGTVANIDSSTKLWVRAYNGTIYEVLTSTPLSPAITTGDTVRVNGYGTTQSLRAGRVVLVRDNNTR